MQFKEFINSQKGNPKLAYKSYFCTYLKEVNGTIKLQWETTHVRIQDAILQSFLMQTASDIKSNNTRTLSPSKSEQKFKL